MESEAAPPTTGQAGGAEIKTVARWRWWLHVLLLGSLPLFIGVMGIIHRNRTTALLPDNVPDLLRVSIYEMLYPALAFCIVWLASRFTAKQMLLSWRGGLMPVLLGFAYSVALRIVIIMVALAVVMVWLLIAGPHSLGQLRSHTGQLVNATVLARDPVYFVLCLTLLSFVVAGLREELWRAAMLAGCQTLFPAQCSNWRGRAVAVVIVGLLFGLGHTTQGFAGVAVTTLLGVGLGAIMLWRRSIWEAVMAHGFFDAATFWFLYLLAKYHPELIKNL